MLPQFTQQNLRASLVICNLKCNQLAYLKQVLSKLAFTSGLINAKGLQMHSCYVVNLVVGFSSRQCLEALDPIPRPFPSFVLLVPGGGAIH